MHIVYFSQYLVHHECPGSGIHYYWLNLYYICVWDPSILLPEWQLSCSYSGEVQCANTCVVLDKFRKRHGGFEQKQIIA